MDNSLYSMVSLLADDPIVRNNPYPLYKKLREGGDLLIVGDNFAVATTHKAVTQVLRDPALGKTIDGMSHPVSGGMEVNKNRPPSMLFQDPPEHTRLRKAVNRAFSAKSVRDYQELIDSTTRELFANFTSQGGGDLVTAIALPLPLNVVGKILGIPLADVPMLQPLVSLVARSLDIGPLADEVQIAEIYEAGNTLFSYFTHLLSEGRSSLRSGLLADLVAVSSASALKVEEICTMALLLFAAGFETTANLIGNIVFAISEENSYIDPNPENDLNKVVEEFIRFDTAVQVDGRVVQQDAEISGYSLKQGTFVLALLGSANRDESIFELPDQLDWSRPATSSLSFASGIHYCLGAFLAKAELHSFLDNFLRIGNFKLRESERKKTLTLRGFSKLEVVL